MERLCVTQGKGSKSFVTVETRNWNEEKQLEYGQVKQHLWVEAPRGEQLSQEAFVQAYQAALALYENPSLWVHYIGFDYEAQYQPQEQPFWLLHGTQSTLPR